MAAALVVAALVAAAAAGSFAATPPVYPTEHTENSTVTVTQNGQTLSIAGFSAYSYARQAVRWSGQVAPGAYGMDVYQNYGAGKRSAMVVQNISCEERPAPLQYADPLAATALMHAAGTATVRGIACDVWQLTDDGVQLTVYAASAAPSTTPVRSIAQIALATTAGPGQMTMQIDYTSFHAGAAADLFDLPSVCGQHS